VVLGAVYNPPNDSQHFNSSFFETLYLQPVEISTKYGNVPIIIAGDFNCRIGNHYEDFALEGSDTLPQIFERESQDTVVTTEGQKMNSSLEEADNLVLNGRTTNN